VPPFASKSLINPVILVVVFLISLLFGLYGSSWGYPYDFHSDESSYLTRVAPNPDIPFWTNYGRWPVYLLRSVAFLAGREANFVFARQLSAFIVALGVAATALTTLQIIGRRGMMMTAALLMGAPLIVQSAHFFTTDVLLMAGTAVGICFSLRIMARGRWRDSLILAVAWGIAIGSKPTGVLLLPAVVLAHALSHPQHRWRRLVVTFLITSSLALVGQPTLFRYGWQAYLYQGAFLSNIKVAAGIFRPPYTLHFADTAAWTYYLTHLFPWGGGPFLTLAGYTGFLAGAARIIRHCRNWRTDAITGQIALVALVFLTFYLFSASQHDKFIRYVLVLLPPIGILAGWLLANLINRVNTSRVWPFLVFTVILSVVPGLLYVRIYSRPDTRLQAAVWIMQHAPGNATICHEPDLGFAVPPIGMGGPAYLETATRNYQGVPLNWGLLYWASDYPRRYHQGVLPDTPATLRTQGAQAHQIAAWIAACDWIILSDRFADQYLPLPDDFPAISSFYRSLLSGQNREFRHATTIQSLPGIGQFVVNDRNSELTFRSFDHPTFWIFQRDRALGAN